MPRLSQLDTLPRVKGLQFGPTIGQGSFAMVKTAHETKRPERVYAVKFIHRAHCSRMGVTDDDIGREIMLHKKVSSHPHVITLLMYGTDDVWLWMAMELATGGDLFDKIEPDVGVDEAVAGFYFSQLVGAVRFLHAEGIAHRDLKPENLLLSARGDLRVADFGLGTVFLRRDGSRRSPCKSACGSPPYMAPEIVGGEYAPDLADIWACGVVLYVLLSGQTPWDEPTLEDPDFSRYAALDGKLLANPWNRFSPAVLSLLRSTMRPDPAARYTAAQALAHPWLRPANPLADTAGLCRDPALLAARLLLHLRVDLSATQTAPPYQPLSATQPLQDLADMLDDEVAPMLTQAAPPLSALDEGILLMVLRDPAMLQFSRHAPARAVFTAERMTRFFSVWGLSDLVALLMAAMATLGVRFADVGPVGALELVFIPVQCLDVRRMPMRGTVKVTTVGSENSTSETYLRVDFVKSKGDPLEWRRLFKRVVMGCSDAIYVHQE